MKSMRLIAECVLVAMAVLCAVSCEKEENESLSDIISGAVADTTDSIISDSKEFIELRYSSSVLRKNYEIETTGQWSVSGTTDWCSVSLDYLRGKTVMVLCLTKNASFCERRTYLTIELGEKTYEVLVRQAAGYNLQFDSKAGSDTTTLSGNMIWNVSGAPEWCDVSLGYGEENTLLTVSVTDNPELTDRYAELQFTCGRDTFYIPVSQECRNYVRVPDDAKELIAPADGVRDTVLIRSNGSWTVTGTMLWCNVTPRRGDDSTNVVINITKNSDKLARETALVFACGNARDTITVHQQGADYVLIQPEARCKLSADASSGTLTIRSSGDWRATGSSDWCSLSATTGQGGDKLVVTATKNETKADREARFAISSGNAVDTLVVTQIGTYVTIAPDKKIEAGNGVSSYELTVNSCTDWNVTGATDWCTVSQTTGVDGDRLTISIVENETFAQRQTTLQFMCGEAIYLLDVTQAPKEDYIHITPEGDIRLDYLPIQKSIAINCGRACNVISSEDWCVIVNRYVKDGEMLTVEVDGNPTEIQRTAQLTITSGSLTKTITVIQSGFSITPTEVVDLGLSVKWAGWNIGATKPEEIGDLFAWGETSTKTEYTQETYKYSEYNLYHEHWYWDYIDIGNNISGTRYDVARAKWKGDWRMPTKTEYEELFNNCESLWVTYKNQKGVMFTGKNGNKLFIPYEYYWTATASYEAYYLYIQIQPDKKLNFKCIYDNYYLNRYEGAPVRAVTD